MKTLDEILDEYAYLMMGEDWETWIREDYEINSDDVREIAKRYADEYAKEALRLASDNATVECDGDEFSHSYIVHKQSILSENNLPKHR